MEGFWGAIRCFLREKSLIVSRLWETEPSCVTQNCFVSPAHRCFRSHLGWETEKKNRAHTIEGRQGLKQYCPTFRCPKLPPSSPNSDLRVILDTNEWGATGGDDDCAMPDQWTGEVTGCSVNCCVFECFVQSFKEFWQNVHWSFSKISSVLSQVFEVAIGLRLCALNGPFALLDCLWQIGTGDLSHLGLHWRQPSFLTIWRSFHWSNYQGRQGIVSW